MNQKKLARFEEEKQNPNYINFSKNWNKKLDCDFFTTIRNVEKASYYQLRVKEKFEVRVNRKRYCDAILKDATVIKFNEVKTPELFVIDTGEMNYMDLFRKFKLGDTFTLLLFERID